MGAAVTIEGLEDTLEVLTDLQGLDLTEALGKAGAIVERRAKQKCPKARTGDLAKGIQYEVSGNTCTVFDPVEYAPYVEYGTGLFAEQGGRTDVPWTYKDEEGKWWSTKGQHPQPFMRPALNEGKNEILEALEGEILK